jgi:hypothetical protein
MGLFGVFVFKNDSRLAGKNMREAPPFTLTANCSDEVKLHQV